MQAIILFNGRSGPRGDRCSRAEIESACAEYRVDAKIIECGHGDIIERARQALTATPKPDLIVAAGGDGTVSAVAGVLAETSMPLGIIPTGTFNHFARDVGVPRTVALAVATLADHQIVQIDIGEVNGHRFVNNSAIGFYPAVVTDRDRQRRQLGRPRWLAQLVAVLHALGRLRVIGLNLDDGSGSRRVRTPLLFVGNNEYRKELQSGFRRKTLTGGKLVMHLVRRRHWWTIFGLLGRLLIGRTDDRDVETRATTALTITTRQRRYLKVALDGEVIRIDTPLHYRILPAALAVAVPMPEAG